MRRLAWALIGVGVIIVGFTPGALGDVPGSYSDRFRTVSYSGSDGSLDWRGPWLEVGENDGPAAGAVRVDSDPGCVAGNCLLVSSDLLELERAGAARLADASVFATADLSYHVGSTLVGGLLGGLSSATLLVEVTTDSGSSWSTVDLVLLSDLDGSGTTRIVSLGAYLTPGFGLRFLVQDLLGGRVMIDDVNVAGVLKPPPVTTTSSTTTTSTVATTTTTDRSTTTADAATTTTSQATTSTSGPRVGSTTTAPGVPAQEPLEPGGPAVPAPDGGRGLRPGGGGIMADYEPGRLSLLPIDLAAEYRSAAERITSRSIGLAGLALVVTGASMLGVDRRRRHTWSEEGTDAITGGT